MKHRFDTLLFFCILLFRYGTSATARLKPGLIPWVSEGLEREFEFKWRQIGVEPIQGLI